MAYTDIAGVRGASQGDDVADESVYPDADVTAAIAYAEVTIDEATGTSFEHKAFTAVLDGEGSDTLMLVDEEGEAILYPRTIDSVEIDGVAVDSAELDGWTLDPAGIVTRDTGVFAYAPAGRNITITGTAGRMAAPDEQIKIAASLIARDWLLSSKDRVSERALNTNDANGTTVIAQPGRHGPTGLPRVNKILEHYDSRVPAGFA
ncbi:MAG: hypothetical protein AAGA90_07930 [Actinomycetota bacterium]